MNKESFADDEKVTSSGTLKVSHLVLIGLLVVGAVTLYMMREDRGDEAGPPVADMVTRVPEGSRAVSLYFAHESDGALLTETRMVAIGKEYAEQLEQVVRALVDGPQVAGVSTIAPGTRLLDVFYDSDAATVFLDFSSELVAGHPGGSSAEYFTIAAIIRTISQNFPEVNAVQLLIEGLQIGTIAGHIDAYEPFRVDDWR